MEGRRSHYDPRRKRNIDLMFVKPQAGTCRNPSQLLLLCLECLPGGGIACLMRR